MELGPRIKTLREEAGLTQVEFAKILKISNTTLSQYESGTRVPGDEIKGAIADHFGVTLDYLYGRTDQKVPAPKSGDGLSDMEQQLMQYVRNLNPDQQQMLLAQMQVMKEAQKGAPPSAVQK